MIRHVVESRLALIPIAAVSIASACQPADRARGEAAVEREQLGDTLHVHSRAPIHRDTATLREIARIGVAEGAEREMLNDVSAFVELPDGRIVVADDAGLRAFSAGGEYLDLVARPGEGPGEVGFVTGLAATPDGKLLAVDLGNRRINVYRRNGELDHWPLPPGMAGNGRNSIVVTRDGEIYVAFNPPLPSNSAPARYPRPIFIELGSDGTATDTLYAGTRFTRRCPTLSSAAWRAGYYEDLREPYFPKVKWALSPSGVLALGCPSEFEVDLIQNDGSVLRITRDAEPVMASAEERQAFVDGHTFSRNRSGYFERWSWEGPQPPERRPAYDRMVFGKEGALWIWPAQPSTRRDVPERFTRQGAPSVTFDISTAGAFDVFNASGEYVGAVRLPDDVPYEPFPGRADPFIRSDTLWAIRYDSLDVPYLTKYVVEWP